MKKAIFFDIDGTLYDFSGYMPASTLRALRQARINGHKLIICSGRARYQIYPELFAMFDGCIGATGAYIEEDNKVLSEQFMTDELIARVISVSEAAGARLAAMTKEHMILSESCRDYIVGDFDARGMDSSMLKRIMGDYEITDNLLGHSGIQKLLFYDSRWTVEEISRRLRDCCDVTESSFSEKRSTDGEITIKGINKSYGIKRYIDSHGIRPEDTIAFGDGPNDLDMLEFVGCGIAMGNSGPELKKVADYVTKDVSEDGIEYAMLHFGLI